MILLVTRCLSSCSSASTGADLPVGSQLGKICGGPGSGSLTSLNHSMICGPPAMSSQMSGHMSGHNGQVAPPYIQNGLVNGVRGGVHQGKYLRDGWPATPLDVANAISEYMSQPKRPQPPAGCSPDAIKLFVGNIPKHCSEAVLCKVFQYYGTIVEIAVVRYNLPRCITLQLLWT
jgi:RNA recognition motif. (a.k.a. RRM, RBD, or RNP domain)